MKMRAPIPRLWSRFAVVPLVGAAVALGGCQSGQRAGGGIRGAGQPSIARQFRWQDPAAEEQWESIIQSSRRLSLAPRTEHADSAQGEGMLEAFGRHHMPNAYERYREARVRALELARSVQEAFPKGKTSDPTGGSLFAKANKDRAVSVARAFRLRDELCFCLLFHQAGIFSGNALAESDAHPLSLRLEEESTDWPDDTPRADTALVAAVADFAAKHLPATLAGYRRLCGIFDEGTRQYGELRRTALALDAPRARNELAFLKTRLEELAAFLQRQKKGMAAQQLAHALEETATGGLAELDLSNAVLIQTFELGMELEAYAGCALSKWKLRWPNGVEVEMAGCPPGTLPTDDPDGKAWRGSGEPRGQGALAQGFWICRHECTWALWETVMGRSSSMFMGGNHPASDVSWDDCQKFLGRLNALPEAERNGLVFRLPTEEEWEYACRAGSKGNYCKIAGGRKITKNTLGEVAWYWDSPSREGDATTYPVGRKKPNAWGLYDMHGNVKEWTSTATASGNRRVYRGGSACDSAERCALGHDRGTARQGHPGFFGEYFMHEGNPFVGFRFVAILGERAGVDVRRPDGGRPSLVSGGACTSMTERTEE